MVRTGLWLLPVLLTGLAACSGGLAGEELVRVRDVRTPMGTYMAMTVYAPDEEAGRRAIAAAFQRVEEVEDAISTWRPHSDASKLNRAAGQGALAVSPHLWAVLDRSLAISRQTGGAFDVTAGPLVALWKGAIRKRELPDPDALAAAKARVDYRALRLHAEGHQAQLLREGMRIDLGGIGKGYIIDQAAAALRAAQVPAALVDAGGDVAALGTPPGRPGWLLGIRDPVHRGRILPRPLCLRDCAAATSGDYEQFVEIAGRRYGHIVDPRTGRPVEGVTSVTVVAPDATAADAYATAATVLGPEAAVALAEKRPDLELLVLHRRGGKLVRAQSSGFGRLELSPEPEPKPDPDP